jgi:hypothetical protein
MRASAGTLSADRMTSPVTVLTRRNMGVSTSDESLVRYQIRGAQPYSMVTGDVKRKPTTSS